MLRHFSIHFLIRLLNDRTVLERFIDNGRGTGSGLGSFITEKLEDAFPKVFRFASPVRLAFTARWTGRRFHGWVAVF